MPVGRPGDDGDVISSSRHYTGRTMGEALVWSCPSCGKKNEGRTPERGCGHCGSGDPSKSHAGGPEQGASPGHRTTARRGESSTPTPPAGMPGSRPVEDLGRDPHEAMRPRKEQGQRVLRMIEYLIYPGKDAREVLRRSLVGEMEMGWGTITGTIVDSIDQNQEECLRRAHMQPGVWGANPTVTEMQKDHPGTISKAAMDARVLQEFEESFRRSLRENTPRENTPMYPSNPQPRVPDTGPVVSVEADDMAARLFTVANEFFYRDGTKFCYTIALALSQIAEEVDGDPDHFLSREQCLELASALMMRIPANWQQPTQAPPGPPTQAAQARVAEAMQRIREGSVPTAVYREVEFKEGQS